jgi:surface polysaccharide O-acyltransferase-like enzyme
MAKQRNYGIDLLRIITMLGVITLHILGHGGVLYNATNPIKFNAAWLLEIIAYPAVNCFLIISGFVGCKRILPSLKSVVMLYLTVLFYSVTICAFISFLYPQAVPTKEIFNAIMPITTNQYWFFTCYIGLLALTPIINSFVNNTDKKTLQKVGLIIFLVFSVYSSFSIHYSSPFKLNDGYSVLWFISLYTIGAIMNKTEFPKKIKNNKAIIAIIISLFITWLVKINAVNGASELLLKLNKSLVNYISPTIVLTSIMLVCIFTKINIKNEFIIKTISILSTSAFSVYLIHDNKYFRSNVIKNSFAAISNYHPIKLIISVLIVALSIFIVGIIIDKMKELLFKILHIEKIYDKLQQKIEKLKKKKIKDA